MGRRKAIVMDDSILTDEQREQCHKNALIWEMVHRDLFSRMAFRFLCVSLKNNQQKQKENSHDRSRGIRDRHGFYEIMRRKWMEQEKELSSLGSDTDK